MLKKIIVIALVVVAISVYLSNMTYAMDNVISSGDEFLAAANSSPVIDEGKLVETSNYVYNILFTIAVVLAVAIGMIIGIQFMIGSAEEQAKVKETLVPYAIGVFVVFASFTIWKIAVNIGNEFSSTSGSTTQLTETTYTITKNGNVTKIKCDHCGHVCYYSTAPAKCPGSNCGYTFTTARTTKTQVNNYTYKCDYCSATYNPMNWRSEYCPGCTTTFK